jgi:putative transposase
MQKISYAGYRFPPEVIHQAIWLYLRFTLIYDAFVRVPAA